MLGGEVPIVLGSPLRPPALKGGTLAGAGRRAGGGGGGSGGGGIFTLFLTCPLAGMCALCTPTHLVSIEAAAVFAKAERAAVAECAAAAAAAASESTGRDMV